MAARSERLFLDTEFNGFGGQLISMGITGDSGREFYEVLPFPETPTPWVREHVIPILGKKPVEKVVFQDRLHDYLKQFPTFTVIADWPEDIAHFNQSLIIIRPESEMGYMMRLPSYRMEVIRDRAINTKDSRKPHNALEDARALKHAYYRMFQ